MCIVPATAYLVGAGDNEFRDKAKRVNQGAGLLRSERMGSVEGGVAGVGDTDEASKEQRSKRLVC